AEQDAELRLGTVVRSVAGGAVELAEGERVEYGRLVIASGATPRRLPVPGMDLDGVFTLRTLSDSTAIRERAREARRAVVVGIGVVPDTEFLESSGLELFDGVVVNERFEASHRGVYAVGDVARFHDPVFGRPRRIEHWSNANYQGGELGRILAVTEGGYD